MIHLAVLQSTLEGVPVEAEGLRPIQPILIALLFVVLVGYLRALRSRLLGRILILALFVLGVVLVLVPRFAMDLAQAVGVGRGADLLFYLGFLGAGMGLILVYARLRSCERQITTLTRELAIERARKPD